MENNYFSVPYTGQVPEFKEGYMLIITAKSPNTPLGYSDSFFGYNNKWYSDLANFLLDDRIGDRLPMTPEDLQIHELVENRCVVEGETQTVHYIPFK